MLFLKNRQSKTHTQTPHINQSGDYYAWKKSGKALWEPKSKWMGRDKEELQQSHRQVRTVTTKELLDAATKEVPLRNSTGTE